VSRNVSWEVFTIVILSAVGAVASLREGVFTAWRPWNYQAQLLLYLTLASLGIAAYCRRRYDLVFVSGLASTALSVWCYWQIVCVPSKPIGKFTEIMSPRVPWGWLVLTANAFFLCAVAIRKAARVDKRGAKGMDVPRSSDRRPIRLHIPRRLHSRIAALLFALSALATVGLWMVYCRSRTEQAIQPQQADLLTPGLSRKEVEELLLATACEKTVDESTWLQYSCRPLGKGLCSCAPAMVLMIDLGFSPEGADGSQELVSVQTWDIGGRSQSSRR